MCVFLRSCLPGQDPTSGLRPEMGKIYRLWPPQKIGKRTAPNPNFCPFLGHLSFSGYVFPIFWRRPKPTFFLLFSHFRPGSRNGVCTRQTGSQEKAFPEANRISLCLAFTCSRPPNSSVFLLRLSHPCTPPFLARPRPFLGRPSPGPRPAPALTRPRTTRHRIWPGEGSTAQWKWSPPAPGSLKALLLPPLLNNVQTRERKGYRRGTARNFLYSLPLSGTPVVRSYWAWNHHRFKQSSRQNGQKRNFTGPNFIHAHPPSPENTLLGVGGV